MPDETEDTVAEPEKETFPTVEENEMSSQKEEKESRVIARKDHHEESDLNDEILYLLMSREKAIHDLNKYGLDVTQESGPQEPAVEEETKKEPEYEIPEKEDLKPSFTEPESGKEETGIKETEQNIFTGFAFDKPEQSGQDVFEEKPDAVYDELDKRLDELRELTAKKESLEEELRQNIVSPEMNIFEKLVEEKPQEPEAPITAFPDIIIHDPGDRYEDKIPKSLSDALEDVQLDGIIEHLENPETVIEEKSYDDVFKPADIPFVPISNREQEIKKQNKLLKFLLYFFFVVIFSIMSFFLYKSILTPSRKAPVDTLGVKVNDSIASKLSLVDTGLNKGAIVLNEFEVEKEGDIIYKQNDNGFIIQIAKFDKYSDALKYVSNLDNKNIHAEIERADLPLNVTEYRIIIGTFETLQEAKSYFKNSGMLLNFIKVLTPFKTTLSF